MKPSWIRTLQGTGIQTLDKQMPADIFATFTRMKRVYAEGVSGLKAAVECVKKGNDSEGLDLYNKHISPLCVAKEEYDAIPQKKVQRCTQVAWGEVNRVYNNTVDLINGHMCLVDLIAMKKAKVFTLLMNDMETVKALKDDDLRLRLNIFLDHLYECTIPFKEKNYPKVVKNYVLNFASHEKFQWMEDQNFIGLLKKIGLELTTDIKTKYNGIDYLVYATKIKTEIGDKKELLLPGFVLDVADLKDNLNPHKVEYYQTPKAILLDDEPDESGLSRIEIPGLGVVYAVVRKNTAADQAGDKKDIPAQDTLVGQGLAELDDERNPLVDQSLVDTAVDMPMLDVNVLRAPDDAEFEEYARELKVERIETGLPSLDEIYDGCDNFIEYFSNIRPERLNEIKDLNAVYDAMLVKVHPNKRKAEIILEELNFDKRIVRAICYILKVKARGSLVRQKQLVNSSNQANSQTLKL